jgi:hypothetical protein
VFARALVHFCARYEETVDRGGVGGIGGRGGGRRVGVTGANIVENGSRPYGAWV